MLNVVLRLRRDNEFNYNKIRDSFIPANGEICLIDTPRDGLRAVCGDGKSTFSNLPYLYDLIQRGYFKDGVFYTDETYSKQIGGSVTKLYINISNNILYYYNGYNFEEIGINPPAASSKQPGIMKLYNEVGYNTDGTMTQKAITEELDTKIELTLKEEEELVIFSL